MQEHFAVSQLSNVSGFVVPLLIENSPRRLFVAKITEFRLVKKIECLEENQRFKEPHPRNLWGDLMSNLPYVPSDNFI